MASATADLGHVAVGRGGRSLGRSPLGPTPAARRAGPRPATLQTMRTPMAWHDLAIGRRIVLTGSVAGTVAAVAAAMAVGIAPIASAAPSEQHCLEQHCLEVEAPTIRQGPANVQIVTSPKAMPAVLPHTNNPKWRGLGYNARWPTLGHNPKWQDFGYDPKWDGFQHSRHIAPMPAPA